MVMSYHLINGITSLVEWCDGQYPSVSLALWSYSLLLLLSSCQIHIPSTMRLCNSRIPDEYLVCYQTSQRNWVIIKMLYRYLQRCLLSWHESRLGFVTPCIGEVSLSPLSNTRHKKLATKVTKELVARWCITERVKRLAGNEIELGIEIPTIESLAMNISTDKRNYVCCHKGSTDKRSL